jgi:NAD(P)H-nitrite reductase large subunit
MDPIRLAPVADFHVERYTPEELAELALILRRHQVTDIAFAASGRLRVAGLNPEQMAILAQELHPLSKARPNRWITSIQACPGRRWCRHGVLDSEEMAARIENIALPDSPPARIKIGIAGCSRCCAEPYVRDIGLIAEPAGWKLVFGGNAGGRPRFGDVISFGLNDDQAIALLTSCLTVYVQHAGKRLRTARFMESFGVAAFLEKVMQNQNVL